MDKWQIKKKKKNCCCWCLHLERENKDPADTLSFLSVLLHDPSSKVECAESTYRSFDATWVMMPYIA